MQLIEDYDKKLQKMDKEKSDILEEKDFWF